jgi:hypothetical protein
MGGRERGRVERLVIGGYGSQARDAEKDRSATQLEEQREGDEAE